MHSLDAPPTVPVPEADQLAAEYAATPTAVERPLRILILDDSPDEIAAILRALQEGGLQPTWERVETAAELQSALAAGPWDAVLSAYTLPGFGAAAALEVVRASDPDLPFIIVSGAVGEDAAVALMRATASDYILKHNLVRLAPTVERELREAGNRRAKRAAERAAAHLAAVVDSSDDAIISKTLDGVITTWNPAAERLYGWTLAEAVGRNVSFLVPPDKTDELATRMARLLAGEEVGYFETVRLHQDGRRLDVAMTLSRVRDAAGRVVGVSKTARDIQERKRAEDALRRSEERARLLVEALPGLVWVYDAAGQPVLHNQRWYEYTGQTHADVAANRWHEAVHPDDAAGAVATWTRCAASGEPYVTEYRLRRTDGEYRWFRSQGTVMTGRAGGDQWVGICTDIDELKRAEARLRESAGLIRAVVEGTTDAVYVKDRDGKYLLFNEAAARFVGRPVADVLGKDDTALFDPAGAARIVTQSRAVMAAGRAETTEEELTAAGATRTYLTTRAPYRDAGGAVVGIIGIARDITDRKRAEDALRLRDRAIGAATQGLIITDAGQPEHPLVYVSPGFERLTGYPAVEALGRNCRFLQGKDTDPAVVTQVREAVRDGAACTVEVQNYRKDGTPFWNELSVSPVRDGAGRVTHFVGVQTDVTARRGLEEQFRQTQKMEAFGQLAGGVAHDFNNLLTIINGYSDLLLQRLPPTDPLRELVAEIHKAGERSAGLTSQLLAFSRQQILAPQVLVPNAVVADAERMLRRLIGEDVRLTATLAPDLGAVRADPGQLEQVVMNLAVNSRDAMPTGGRLTIETRNVELDEAYARTHPDARPGGYVLLSVSDTGTGMRPEVMARVFEPFFTTKEKGKGTGLGLATVLGIVRQSGGHVAVYSEVGIGTTVKIYLPRVEAAAGGGSHVRSGLRALPRGRETILLVEDDDAVRQLARHVLTLLGYTVLDAAGGADALRVVDGHAGAIDLLVTDVVMPGMSGRQVADRLAGIRPETGVLFVSGYTDDAVVRHGILEERVHFLPKPYSPSALAAKVRDILDASATAHTRAAGGA
jgi:two-component system cell cycle sensor histidine kinase/response regulator CckA